jgi:uncharacterized protein
MHQERLNYRRMVFTLRQPECSLKNRPASSLLMGLSCLTILSLAMTSSTAMEKKRIQTLQLMAGPHRIEAEIAATPALRAEGLMNRHFLPADHGMLFVFPAGNTHCMWMHNTKIPLNAAFLDEQGVIVLIAEMQPDTDDYHCATTSVNYVIEMRSGWFREKGIAPGTRIYGLDKAPIGQ